MFLLFAVLTSSVSGVSGSQLEEPEAPPPSSLQVAPVAISSLHGVRPCSYGPLYMSATVENFEYESDYALSKIPVVGDKRNINEVQKSDDMVAPPAKKIGLFSKCFCLLVYFILFQ